MRTASTVGRGGGEPSVIFLVLFLPAVHSLLICNKGTEHECVCQLAVTESMPDGSVDCAELIAMFQSRDLPVVELRVRNVNISGRLYTGESYENYFKRRIAAIVSAYCEKRANDCPGTGLRLQTALPIEDSDSEESAIYNYDPTEPLLTQDNVLLLRVEHETDITSSLAFVVSRQLGVRALSENNIVDPVKVKNILGEQTTPLSRVLGGIPILSVRTTRLKRELKAEERDNTRLLVFVYVIGGFFLLCYIIGGVRLYRDHQKKKQEQRKKQTTEEDGIVQQKSVPNYGACKDKGDEEEKRRRKSVDKPNGRLASIPRDQAVASPNLTENSLRAPSVASVHSRVESPIVYNENSLMRMFMCDPSQLPAEEFDSDITGVVVHPRRHTHSHIHHHHHGLPPKPQEVIPKPVPQEPEKPATAPVADELPADLPALVLVPSTSQHDSALSSNGSSTEAPSSWLPTRDDEIPLHRPKSRRGSRVEDDSPNLPEIATPTLNVTADLPPKSRTAQQLDRWSSSEGEIDVYYKMSDDEEVKADDWVKPPEHHDAEEEDEEAEGDIVYERLHEDPSPVPPKSLDFTDRQQTFSDEEVASPNSVEDLR